MTFTDRVTKLCLGHFSSVVPPSKFKPNEWTVLSCIVMEDHEILQVVAMGTGSKCIGKNKMSRKGDILNDSHAEVICRRAFLRYLYEQMLHNPTNSLLVFDEIIGKFKIKQGIKFHLFTTHVPCGDAAIHPKLGMEDFGNILTNNSSVSVHDSTDVDINHGQKRLRNDDSGMPLKKRCIEDVHRTGAKCLKEGELQDDLTEGMSYHVTGVVRTKPGRGDPTLSVSCSDKIARWCCLGIQGALMSLVLSEPIYITSFIIAGGTPFNKEASVRAFYDRIRNVCLTQPYKLNMMEILQANEEFKYAKKDDKVASPLSVIWFRSNIEKKIEISVDGKKQGVTKKKINTESARLKICKLELFKQFVSVVKSWPVTLPIAKTEVDVLCYQNIKDLAISYQNNWFEVKKMFKTWTKKDPLYVKFLYTE